MEPQELLTKIQNRSELFSWLLRLVPPNSGGSDLTKLPPDLKSALCQAGITGTDPIEKLTKLMHAYDWARDEFQTVLRHSERLRRACTPPGGLAVGTTNDAEFNGHVYRCHTANGVGYAIALPMGAMTFVSFAAEMVCLFVSDKLSASLAQATAVMRGAPEPSLTPFCRRLRRWSSRSSLLKVHGRRLGWQYGMLINRYVDLGTADPPDSIRELGSIPDFGRMQRIGHALEGGSNLRIFALRFLLLHECGHVALHHFDEIEVSAERRLQQEFDADKFAIQQWLDSDTTEQTIAAFVLGAWLIFTLSRRIDHRQLPGEQRFTHPPAIERLRQLREIILVPGVVSIPRRDNIFALLGEIETLEEKMIEESESFLGEGAALSTTLSRLLQYCSGIGKSEIFFDQLPRWLLFGAPLRLCSELGRLRANLERRLELKPNNQDIAAQLKLIMWVFTAADEGQSPSFLSKLHSAYFEACAQPRGNRDDS